MANPNINIPTFLTSLVEESTPGSTVLSPLQTESKDQFKTLGIPSIKNEEWKYTNIAQVLKETWELKSNSAPKITKEVWAGTEKDIHLWVLNGQAEVFATEAKGLTIKTWKQDFTSHENEIIKAHWGCSNAYLKDGIQALNSAYANEGFYIEAKEGYASDQTIYIHYVHSGGNRSFSMLRHLVYVSKNAQLKVVELHTASAPGNSSFSSVVNEILVCKDALLQWTTIQQGGLEDHNVHTTHVAQLEKSEATVNTFTFSGGVVRNNLQMVLDAEYALAHMNALYLVHGDTHIDNHTVADHRKPNGESNELYKGVLDGDAVGVFNGKIFVREKAQKTNAYQSNKNILLSNSASVNTKPQLEIFADDVKCSHGCTTGQLDEEALFYLRARGISEKLAKAMLTKAYVQDILDKVTIPEVKLYLETVIEERFSNPS